MGKQSTKGSLGRLEPEQLIEFIDQLRREYKYNIGVSQYIAAQELILALSAKGEHLKEPQRLKSLLGPLLCSSPAEQEDFQLRFDQWMKCMDFTVEQDMNYVVRPYMKLKVILQRCKSWLKKIQQQWLLFLAIAVVIVIVLTNFLRFSTFPFLIEPLRNPIIQEKLMLIQLLMFLVFILPLIILVVKLWKYWCNGSYLNRRQTRQPPEIPRVSISDLNEELFPRVLFLRIAQGLRQRIPVPSNELDIEKTVEKTVLGVRFAPVYRYYKVIPEYLVLIDRTNYSDHQARFVKEMMAQLIHNEVLIVGYYFDSDPRVCFPVKGKGPPCKLEKIALKYSHHRLLVFSDTEGFFNSLTGKPEAWLDLFSSWSERAILIPKPSEHWGYQELELSRKFIVLPATNDGLIDLIQSIEYEKFPSVSLEKDRAPYPEELRMEGLRWVERDPPELPLLTEVLKSLRSYLGEAGYYWLSACAVFPKLNWNLTVYLGNTLSAGDGHSLLQACRLTVIARLPWFRYGYMPDWLRLALISKLPPQQEDEVRQVLRSFLVAQSDDQGSVGKLEFRIWQHSNVLWRLAQLLPLFGKAPEASSLQDYIFQEFMVGHKVLAVRIPEELQEKLRRKDPQQVGWKFFLGLLNRVASRMKRRIKSFYMSKHNINNILQKIYDGNYSQIDLDILKENIDLSGNGNVVKIGNENINISTNKYIVIGHVTYHGNSAEVIRRMVEKVIDEGKVSFKPIFLSYWLTIDTVLGGLITCYIAFENTYLLISERVFSRIFIPFIFAYNQDILLLFDDFNWFTFWIQLSIILGRTSLMYLFIGFVYEYYPKKFQLNRIKHSLSVWYLYSYIVRLLIVKKLFKISYRIFGYIYRKIRLFYLYLVSKIND